MRVGLAAILLVMIGAPLAAEADDMAAALTNVPPALDGAEAALGGCPQPEIGIRGRKAIIDARAYLGLARTNPEAMLALNEKMDFIRNALQTCLQLKKIADDFHSKCQGEVRLGMTRDQVRQSNWCQPTKVMTTETPGHTREEWIYTSDVHQLSIGRPAGFLYFTDGKLTSIEREAR